MYVANIDYGSKNKREHYHALINCEKIDFKEDAVFLCGKNYYKYLITKFKKGSAPMAHMRIGEQQKFLKERIYDEK